MALKEDPLAQMVEHMTFNHGVRSSTLRWVTKQRIGTFLSVDETFSFFVRKKKPRRGSTFVCSRRIFFYTYI